MTWRLNGDGGEVLGLQDVAEEFGNTPAGERAAYLAASALLNKGSYDEALEYLSNKCRSTTKWLHLWRFVLKEIATCKWTILKMVFLNYLKAANLRDNTFTTPYALMKAAKVQMHIEDWDGALESLQRVKKDYKLTQYAALTSSQRDCSC